MSFRHILTLIICIGTSINALAIEDTSSEASSNETQPLLLTDVTQSVATLYPPLLSALIERDVAAGHLQATQGTFDFNVFAKAFGTPAGFYETETLHTGFEKFTGLWGSTLFGSYRLTEGDLLPDYYRYNRTQEDGRFELGLKVPLLRDGRIDKRRAAVLKARYDAELADPLIQRQRVDYMQVATKAYFQWLAAGTKLYLAQEQLNLARDRIDVLQTQVDNGLLKKIVVTDNRRLVVDREISTIKARRTFEAAALTLSLLYRDDNMEPLMAELDRLPKKFPQASAPQTLDLNEDLRLALRLRPEIKQIEIKLTQAGVDIEKAENELLPSLDAYILGYQNLGNERYKDFEDFELEAAVEFRMPLERREAKGNRIVAKSKRQQLLWKSQFARERVINEVRNAYSALVAAHEQIGMAQLNVDLAEELEQAEKELFKQGASDFLAVQLRERSTFDARIKQVDAVETFFVSLAAYQAASMQL